MFEFSAAAGSPMSKLPSNFNACGVFVFSSFRGLCFQPVLCRSASSPSFRACTAPYLVAVPELKSAARYAMLSMILFEIDS